MGAGAQRQALQGLSLRSCPGRGRGRAAGAQRQALQVGPDRARRVAARLLRGTLFYVLQGALEATKQAQETTVALQEPSGRRCRFVEAEEARRERESRCRSPAAGVAGSKEQTCTLGAGSRAAEPSGRRETEADRRASEHIRSPVALQEPSGRRCRDARAEGRAAGAQRQALQGRPLRWRTITGRKRQPTFESTSRCRSPAAGVAGRAAGAGARRWCRAAGARMEVPLSLRGVALQEPSGRRCRQRGARTPEESRCRSPAAGVAGCLAA